MVRVDFSTTAMARPDVLDMTYWSFSNNLKDINLKDCRLFINIEPLPVDVDRNEVIKVAEGYFGEVHANCPNKANFTAACNWLWSNADAEYIFHLEDDWCLIKEISIKSLLRPFKGNPKLLEVALRAYPYVYKVCPLSPNVMHERYYKAIAGKLDESLNPEIQLRGKKFGIDMPDKTSYKGKVYVYPEDFNDIVVKDIGRKWMKSSKYKKGGSVKAGFTTWEEK